MIYKNMFCSMLLLLLFAGAISANERSSPTGRSARLSPAALTSLSVEKLNYQNILDASRWSKLTVGRKLAVSLRKKAHASLPQDFGDDELFAVGAGSGGSGCGWSCCFKICMNSAMQGAGTTCITSCTACFLTGSAWSCAMCASCGAVGFAAIEFCALHCCVNPGC